MSQCFTTISFIALFSGWRTTLPFRLYKRFNVVSPFIIATTISPFSAVFCCLITIRSSSLMPASIILSPFARNINRFPLPKMAFGRAKVPSIFSTASTGCPQAIEPTSGASVNPLGLSLGITDILPSRVLSIFPAFSRARRFLRP